MRSAFTLPLAALIVAGCQGCSATQDLQGAIVGIDTALCVLAHDTDPPLQIVTECGVPDIATVQTILDAEHAAMMRRLSALDAGGQ